MQVQEGVIGRDQERARIEAFLEGPRPAALVIDGEAGIGKTTLWSFALAEAGARGDRVLSWRAGTAEREMAFAALMGLVEPDGLEEHLAVLSSPRRAALEVSLGRVEPGDRPPDPALVGMAVADMLRAFAASGPVVVAVDDLQSCDRASLDALAFAARRLGAAPIAFVLSSRTDADAPATQLSEALGPDRRERLSVGPLSVGALGRLIHERMGVAHPRPLLVRLHEATGGNPFLAMEVTRTLIARGSGPRPGEPFPVPPEASLLVRDRLASLSPGARRALLVASISSHPTLGLLERTLGPEARAALDEAYRTGVIAIEGDRLRPSHPLVASTTYADAAPGERRGLRMALAVVVDDPVERAIHLAATVEGTDAAVAEAVEAAGRTALGRGAPGVGADLFQRAAALEPEAERQVSLLIEAARASAGAGDAGRAEALLGAVLDRVPGGRRRAEALLELGEVVYIERPAEALPLLMEALDHSEDDALLAGTAHSYVAAMADMDPEATRRSVHAAVEILERPSVQPDPDLLACALLERAYHWLLRCDRVAGDDIDRAIGLLSGTGDSFVARRAQEIAERCLSHQGRLGESLALDEAEYRRLSDRGQVGLLPPLVQSMAVLCQLMGDWKAARRYAQECLDLVEQGEEVWRQRAVMARARTLAWEGDLDAARPLAVKALAQEEEAGDDWEAAIFAALLGFIEISVPDPPAALHHLRATDRHARKTGVVLPSTFRYLGDLVEAAVLAGELDLAERVLTGRLERPAERVPLPWIMAMAARGRGLLCAARGDVEQAVPMLDRSVDLLTEACPMPFERARSLFCRGQVRRKAGHRRAARQDLEEALVIFRTLGAKAWARRAEEDLRRIGGRAASAWELTASERRVAELAAAGRSNREVAAELFLSVRTVESQLSAAYRKLGVRSRSHLAGALQASEPPSR